MTRDSLIWSVTFVSSVLAFLANGTGLLHAAFPALGATGEARIAFAAAIAGFISGYMKMSPLPLSPEHRLATNEASTVLSPMNSSKTLGVVLLACALAGVGAATSSCAATRPPAGTYTPEVQRTFDADQAMKALIAVSQTAINLNATTGREHLSDRDTALVRDYTQLLAAAVNAYGTGATTLQAAETAIDLASLPPGAATAARAAFDAAARAYGSHATTLQFIALTYDAFYAQLTHDATLNDRLVAVLAVVDAALNQVR